MRSFIIGRFRLVALLLVAAFGVPVLFAPPASADQPEATSLAYHEAFALWEFPQPDGSLKRIGVDAIVPARSSDISLLFATYIEFDSSGAILHQIRAISAEMPKGQLHLYGTVERAKLLTSAPAIECPFRVPFPDPDPLPAGCSLTTLVIDLSWAGLPPNSRVHSVEHFVGEGEHCRIKSSLSFQSRFNAVASGTVSAGTLEFTGGESSSFATIGKTALNYSEHGDCLVD